jgi:large subunit ribosomal protein L23
MASQRPLKAAVFGKKEVFLYVLHLNPFPTSYNSRLHLLQYLTSQPPRPNFVLTLLRTPNNPPNFATFLVPLSLNKLDLRDYLFHAYGIRVHGVRSYIQMQKIQQDKPGAKRPKPRKWFRPKSIKKMMVEMERPFVWPEEPKEYDMYVLIFQERCRGRS